MKFSDDTTNLGISSSYVSHDRLCSRVVRLSDVDCGSCFSLSSNEHELFELLTNSRVVLWWCVHCAPPLGMCLVFFGLVRLLFFTNASYLLTDDDR